MNQMIFHSSSTSHVGDFHCPKILHCNDEDVGEPKAFFFWRGENKDKKKIKNMGGVSEAPIIRKWEVCTDICSRLGGLESSVDHIQWSNVRPAAPLVARTRRNFFGWHALLTDTHVDFLRKREPLQNLPGASSDKICWVYGLRLYRSGSARSISTSSKGKWIPPSTERISFIPSRSKLKRRKRTWLKIEI